MNYWISYAMTCNIGKRRKTNQDNFWCNGSYLDEINKGINEIRSGVKALNERPVFAVFDGMGGEERGEAASFLAAKTTHAFLEKRRGFLKSDDLRELFAKINGEITAFGEAEDIGIMGTTGAMLAFGKKNVTLCNIGDSPIFRLNNNVLTKLSVDHSVDVGGKKAPLTQFLGVPEREFVINPYTDEIAIEADDRYLVCSDGVTDMVDIEEIEDIMLEEGDVGEASRKLLRRALENGGRDNITFILLEITKPKLLGKNRL